MPCSRGYRRDCLTFESGWRLIWCGAGATCAAEDSTLPFLPYTAHMDDSTEEMHRIALQQAVETYRVQMTLLFQSLGFFIAGNVTILTLAVVNGRAVLFIIGAVLVAFWVLVRYAIFKAAMPVAYVAYKAERALFPEGGSGVITQYLAIEFPRTLSAFDRAHDMPPIEANRFLGGQRFIRDRLRGVGPLLLALWILMQIALALVYALSS